MQFDWDLANLEHIARHKVEPQEAEEAVTDPAGIPAESAHRGPAGERRAAIVGATETGRVLYVVLTGRGDRIRVVTARPANAAERYRYETEE